MSDGDQIHIPETLVPGFRLGRHINHDPRSRGFAVDVAALTPRTKVWPRHVMPFNQGNTGSCVGQALVGCAATEPSWFKNGLYSEKQAVKCYGIATQLDSFPGTYPPTDTGSDGLSGCKAVVQLGLATRYLWGFGVDDLTLIISNIGPAAVGTNWHTGMDTPDANGLVTVTGAIRGGHEYEVLGYHLKAHAGMPLDDVFECQNSWGAGWGVRGTTAGRGGRFFISRSDMNILLAEGGDCVTLSTDKAPSHG